MYNGRGTVDEPEPAGFRKLKRRMCDTSRRSREVPARRAVRGAGRGERRLCQPSPEMANGWRMHRIG